MSFSLNVPRQDSQEQFEDALYAARATPKVDGRSKVGKRQNALVDSAKDALVGLSIENDAPSYWGNVSGHVNADLTGSVSVTLFLGAEVEAE